MLQKPKSFSSQKGSVLVFSLIVLSFMLVSALSISTVSVSEQKISGTSNRSNVSFQAADSGIEIILQKIYKGNFASSPLSALGSCSDGIISGSTGAGTYKVSFYSGTGQSDRLTSCSDSSWRSRTVRIISQGAYAGTTRAVEVGVAPAP